MPAEPTGAARGMLCRVSEVIGVRITAPDGRDLGRIVDVVAEPDERGRLRLTGVLVMRGPWGRLLGYEREEVRGPWLLKATARWILRRRLTRVPWDVVQQSLTGQAGEPWSTVTSTRAGRQRSEP